MQIEALRLTSGTDVKKAIEQIVSETQMKSGVIMAAVGSLDRVCLRLAGANQVYSEVGPYELVSLQGTLSVDGVHLHASVADSHGRTFGGHVLPGCTVRTTCELAYATNFGLSFHRLPDPDTGFEELVITSDDGQR
jgi:uncharacterized protein